MMDVEQRNTLLTVMLFMGYYKKRCYNTNLYQYY